MTFVVSLQLKADAKDAKKEIADTAAEAKKLGTETQDMGRKSRDAGTGVGDLTNAAQRAQREMRSAATAETLLAAEAEHLKKSHLLAAGGVNELGGAVNHLADAAAEGQPSLENLIGQGSEITDAFGADGATGVIEGLALAFLGSLNPIDLITKGALLAGEAMFKWLIGAGEEAPKLDEAISNLSKTITDFRAIVNDQSFDALAKRFGAVTPEVVALQKEMKELALRQLAIDADEAAKSLSNTFNVLFGAVKLSKLFSLDFTQLEEMGNQLKQIRNADGIQSQVDAIAALKRGVLDATGGIAQMNAEQKDFYQSLVDAEATLREARSATVRIQAEANGRFAGAEAAKQALDYRLEEQRLIRQANLDAQALVATLQAEAIMRAQILLFGQDSELVTQNRLAAEREALAAQMEAEGVAANHAARVLEAWDAAKGFNAEAAGMSGFLSSAAAEAARMAGNIWDSVTAMAAVRNSANQQLAQMSVEFSPGGQAMMKYGSRAPGGTAAQKALEVRNQPPKVRPGRGVGAGRGGAGGGGVSEIEKQRKALDSLIEREERELALLRETDPVQKEMLRHRDAMAGATEAERAKVEELIGTRMRETEAMKGLEWASDLAGGTLVDALMGGKDAGDQLIQTLKRAALEALVLGKGPLADLFGIAGGGIGKVIAGAFAGKFATGGMIHGPGSGTSDDVPILASNGEFMVNAKATARYRHMLEAMNSGAPIPGFANGGAIGGGVASVGGSVVQIFNQSSTPVSGEVEESTNARGQRQMKLVLSDAVADGISTPGGKASRTMKQVYGVTRASRRRS